jgi:hypothetical protein
VSTKIMAIKATFNPSAGLLSETGDDGGDTIVTSRDAAGRILINGGAVAVDGGTATVANTSQIQVFSAEESHMSDIDMRIFARSASANVGFPSGSIVFNEGDPASCMYIVQSGVIEMLIGGTVVDVCGPNEACQNWANLLRLGNNGFDYTGRVRYRNAGGTPRGRNQPFARVGRNLAER